MKKIYTLISPEGREFIIGAYATEGTAKAAAKRHFLADWLGLCCYPLEQREVQEGETVEKWKPWEGN